MLHWPENRSRPAALDAVLFDAGHTLIRPRGTVEEIYAQHARAAGRPVAELVPEIRRHFGALFSEAREEMARGEDGFGFSDEADRALWRRICLGVADRVPGLTDDPEGWFEEVYDRFGQPETWEVFEDVPGPLASLDRMGVRVAVVSNWDSRLKRILDGLDLGVRPAEVVISAAVGTRKPGPRIFQAALDTLGVQPERTLMVGDSVIDDVEGAERAGLWAVLVRRSGDPPPAGVAWVDRLSDLLALWTGGQEGQG